MRSALCFVCVGGQFVDGKAWFYGCNLCGLVARALSLMTKDISGCHFMAVPLPHTGELRVEDPRWEHSTVRYSPFPNKSLALNSPSGFCGCLPLQSRNLIHHLVPGEEITV